MASPAARSEPSVAPPVVLSYHADDGATAAAGGRWPRVVVLVAALPLLVASFVPFTHGISPWLVVAEVSELALRGRVDQTMALALLAAPFFAGVAIFLWHARLLVSQVTTRAERTTGYSISALSGGMTIGYFAWGMFTVVRDGDGFGRDMLIASTAAAIAALAVTTPWWPRRIGDRAEARTTVALSLAYLANASQCLAWFGDARDLGWWLTLAGSIALVAELVWIAIAARRSTR